MVNLDVVDVYTV